MRIAVDLDGVCYEWDKTARYMLRTLRGCKGLEAPSPEWLLPNQPWHTVTHEDWQWLWSEGVEEGLFRYGHVMKGTIVSLQALERAGNRLIIVTHRPERAIKDTVAWLDLNFDKIPLYGLHVLSDGAPKTTIQWDILIDDKVKNVKDALGKGRSAILFDQTWNQEAYFDMESGKYHRARGWQEAVRCLES